MTTPWRPQGDGSTWQWNNCTLVSAGRAIKRHFAGIFTPTKNLLEWNSTIAKQADGTGWNSKRPTMGERTRAWIMNKYGITGGVTIPKALEAVQALWGTMTGSGYRWNVSWELMLAYVKAGRGVVTIIDYDVVHGTPYDASPAFDGRHAIFIESWRQHTWTDAAGVKHSRGEFLVFDALADHRRSTIPQGGPSGQWWPTTLVKRGATKSMGSTINVEFGFTRDTVA